MTQEREREMLTLLGRYGFTDLKSNKLLEIGCGNGYWRREFIKWGARPENVVGIDLLEDRAAEAKRLSPAQVKIAHGSAAELRFLDESFDSDSSVNGFYVDSRLICEAAGCL